MTTGDWDFNNACWKLDDGQYVSSPSSLQSVRASPDCLDDPTVQALVKTSVVPIASVKEGRIDTKFRYGQASDVNKLLIFFRLQDSNNYYRVRIRGDGSILITRLKAGVSTTIASGTFSNVINTWQRFRIIWWDDAVGLVIRVEMYVSPDWVKKAQGYDTPNYWSDVGGRIGLALLDNGPAYRVWVDDTIIYGA